MGRYFPRDQDGLVQSSILAKEFRVFLMRAAVLLWSCLEGSPDQNRNCHRLLGNFPRQSHRIARCFAVVRLCSPILSCCLLESSILSVHRKVLILHGVVRLRAFQMPFLSGTRPAGGAGNSRQFSDIFAVPKCREKNSLDVVLIFLRAHFDLDLTE